MIKWWLLLFPYFQTIYSIDSSLIISVYTTVYFTLSFLVYQGGARRFSISVVFQKCVLIQVRILLWVMVIMYIHHMHLIQQSSILVISSEVFQSNHSSTFHIVDSCNTRSWLIFYILRVESEGCWVIGDKKITLSINPVSPSNAQNQPLLTRPLFH